MAPYLEATTGPEHPNHPDHVWTWEDGSRMTQRQREVWRQAGGGAAGDRALRMQTAYAALPPPPPQAHRTVTYRRKQTNHLLHLILTALTCGAWVFVWFGVWLWNAFGPRGKQTTVYGG